MADYENAKIQRLLREGPTQCVFAYTNNMAVRRDVMHAVGPFAPWPIGGDVEWIQRCLARFSRDQVVYLEDMVVLHLEVTGLHVWLKKQWFYGTALDWLERETAYRVLAHRQRVRSYHDCLDLRRYSLKRKVALFCILTGGVLCFKLGQIHDLLGGRS